MSADDRTSGEPGRTKSHGSKSEAVRDAAILALLTEKWIAPAAERCGVNERTLRRWLADDAEFKAAYETMRRATFAAEIARVQPTRKRAFRTFRNTGHHVDLDERSRPVTA